MDVIMEQGNNTTSYVVKGRPGRPRVIVSIRGEMWAVRGEMFTTNMEQFDHLRLESHQLTPENIRYHVDCMLRMHFGTETNPDGSAQMDEEINIKEDAT